MTRPQLDILIGADGRLAVDFVMRFERLRQDFELVCDRIGRPRSPMPRLNATPHAGYRSY